MVARACSNREEVLLVGIDEAGYGPLLGPYVIAQVCFLCRSRKAFRELSFGFWPSLAPLVSKKPERNRLAVADSKALYRRKSGFRCLEEGVLSFLHSRGMRPRSFRELLRVVGEEPGALDRYPWYRGQDIDLPLESFRAVVASFGKKLKALFRHSSLSFVSLYARVIRAGEFNKRLENLGNKAEVALEALASMLRRLFLVSRRRECFVVVDRQGGRKHYGRFLFNALQPKGIVILAEEDEQSIYRAEGRQGEKLTVKFSVESEDSAFPVALASMAAKYLRELHMLLLNNYFRARVSADLKPTSGYVQDARRFLSELACCAERVGFPLELLVRQR